MNDLLIHSTSHLSALIEVIPAHILVQDRLKELWTYGHDLWVGRIVKARDGDVTADKHRDTNVGVL